MAKLVHKEQSYTGGRDTSDLIKWSEATTSVKKNLLKNTATSETVTGLTFTVNADGSVTANGTSTASWAFEINRITIPKGSYILSDGDVGNSNIFIQVTNSAKTSAIADTINGESVMTFNSDTDIVVRIFWQNGITVSNLAFKPMIRLASIADATYEPYIPDNTELMRYTDNAVLGAKNLLPNNATSQTVNGVTFTKNADGTVTANGTASADISLFLLSGSRGNTFDDAGNTFTLSGRPLSGVTLNGGTCQIYVGEYVGSSWVFHRDNGSGITFAYNSARTLDNACIWITSGVTLTNAVFKPMLRLATDTDDTYVPYAMTNRELTEGVGSIETEIGKINNNSLGKETIIRITNESGTWGLYGSGRFTSTTVLHDIITYLNQNHVKADVVKIYSNSNGNAFNYSLPIQSGALTEIICSPYAYSIGYWDRGYVKVTNYANGDVYMAGIISSTVGTFKKVSYTS